jgi:hypothetical protein
LLDDTIEMAKRLNDNNVKLNLLISDQKHPHAFLNMQNITVESHEAHREVIANLKQIIQNLTN